MATVMWPCVAKRLLCSILLLWELLSQFAEAARPLSATGGGVQNVKGQSPHEDPNFDSLSGESEAMMTRVKILEKQLDEKTADAQNQKEEHERLLQSIKDHKAEREEVQIELEGLRKTQQKIQKELKKDEVNSALAGESARGQTNQTAHEQSNETSDVSDDRAPVPATTTTQKAP
mmetsp:Transcript_38370/g.90199  ORF Transcript_38370/g.90199 Transcript_38370/m.90199 type:complete len:175 (+) Transcript_38370:42-566(+)